MTEALIGEFVEAGFVELQTGPFGTQLHSYDYLDDGVPVIPTEGIVGGRIDHSVLPKISRAKADELFRHRLELGDILFARRGVQATGKTSRIRKSEEDFICGTGAIRLRVSPKQETLDADFLAWFLTSPDTILWIREQAIGATMPNLNEGIIKRLSVQLPSLPEQREIAAILGALDDKIEVNRKASATLEAMARALYRSWFVDFDPVWAKLENRPPAHMPPQTAALFPDSFDDDGLPLGWDLVPYLDFVEIISGGTPKTTEPSYWNGAIPWYSVVDAPPTGQVFVHSTGKTISADGFQASAVKLVPRGTTIISARGTVGKLAIAGQDMVFNQSCYGLQGREERLDAFVYFATERAIEQLLSMAHGSVFATITRKTFEGLDLPHATPRVLRAFEATCGDLLGRIHSFGRENQTLATLRDSLLPRLMSGELRVGDARAQVEEVA